MKPFPHGNSAETRTRGACTMFICRVVGVAFWLTVCAASAHADCAWVLWFRYADAERKEGSDMSPARAFSGRSECEQARQEGEAGSEKENKARAGAGRPHVFTTFLCLPDTVDPRGPKGK